MDPTHVRASVGLIARICLHKFCENAGCSLEDLPGTMNDRDGWKERIMKTRTEDDDDKEVS